MKRLIALLALATAVLSWPGAGGAVNGDNLRTIIADRGVGSACASFNAAGDHASVGTGIAFDGTNLLLSCWGDNQIVAVSPVDGSYVATHVVAGASHYEALAWDGTRNKLWACGDDAVTVGLIDLTLDTFTPQFTIVGPGVFGPGCRDGLAYDASDDTIWASGDVSPTVEHYSTTGIVLSSNAAALGFCNNSGIAVGGPLLYLANDGCSEIYTVDKAFSAAPAFFASFPRRLEDMECDNVNFPGVGAIWSNDAYDNILNAWEIPAGTCTFGGGGGEEDHRFMTGGGSVYTSSGARVTHGFQLHCSTTNVPNHLEVNWGKGNRFHLTSLTSAACSDDPAIAPDPPPAGFDTLKGKGDGTYNGQAGASIEFTFTDAGEPGSNDTATMTIKDASNAVVLTVSGTLNSGNHQAHAGG